MKSIVKFKLTFTVILLFSLLTGCATILGEKTAVVTVNSVPSGAKVLITDESGLGVFNSTTPTTVTLAKSTGHYWGKKGYIVDLTLTGYKEQKIALTEHVNGWYFGNILLGGVIGMLLIDPWNGGMYTLRPTNINTTLESKTVADYRYKKGSLTFMLVQDVPASLRSKMVKVGQLSHL